MVLQVHAGRMLCCLKYFSSEPSFVTMQNTCDINDIDAPYFQGTFVLDCISIQASAVKDLVQL